MAPQGLLVTAIPSANSSYGVFAGASSSNYDFVAASGGGKFYVMSNGEIIWEMPATYPTMIAGTDSGIVYVGSSERGSADGTLQAYNFLSNELLWTYSGGADSHYLRVDGDGNLVFTMTDRFGFPMKTRLVKLDGATGQEIWSVYPYGNAPDDLSFGSDSPVAVGSAGYYIAPKNQNTLIKYDSSGAEIWRSINISVDTTSIIEVAGETFIIGPIDGSEARFKIAKISADTGQVISERVVTAADLGFTAEMAVGAWGMDLAIKDGAIFVSGILYTNALAPQNVGDAEVFVAKFSDLLDVQWAYNFGGNGYDIVSARGTSLTLGATGEITVFASSEGTASIGGVPLSTNNNFTVFKFRENAGELSGTAASDIFFGSAEADTVSTLDGNDIVTAGAGNDVVDAGAGDDLIVGGDGAGDDVYMGGLGLDTVKYTSATAGIFVDLMLGTAKSRDVGDAAGIGTDKLSGIENIIAGSFNDILTGDGAANTLEGLAGDDSLSGGSGNDTLDGGMGEDTARFLGVRANYTVAANADGSWTVTDNFGTDGVDRLLGVEFVEFSDGIVPLGGPTITRGTANADILTGTAAQDEIYGLAGDDVIDSQGGDDVLDGGEGNDSLNGGSGVDTVSYAEAGRGVTVSLALTVSQNTVGAGRDTLTNIENLVGSEFADALTGSSGDNFIEGGLGNDTITGGAGTDRLDGGEGSDLYVLTAVGDMATAEIVDSGAAGTDELRLAATTAGTLTLFAGDTGLERVVIGTGTGAVAVTTATTALNVNGAAVNNGLIIVGNSGNNALTGTAFDDTLDGGAGNDTLVGGAGNDTLIGGAGNDILTGNDGTDTANYASSTAAVTVSLASTAAQNTGGAGTDTLSGIENLVGSGLNDTLTGSATENRIDGGAGNDVINGAAGADTLDGGQGSDIYVLTVLGDKTSAEIADSGTTGEDELRFAATVAGTLTLFAADTGLERVVIGTGVGAAAVSTATTALSVNASAVVNGLTIVGNAGANVLTGTASADVLDGGAGNDTLLGGAGNDTLTGGNGADQLNGGDGSDIYILTALADRTAAEIADNGPTGVDELRFAATTAGTLALQAGDVGLERVVIGTGTGTVAVSTATTALNVNAAAVTNGLTIIGNAGANTLTGTSSADWIAGGGGNDVLNGGAGDDTLNGGTGRDTLIGGAGNDTYITDGADTITEAANAGTDTVQSSVTYTLGVNVENLTLTGATAINGIGNTLNNVIIGNGAANTLTGGTGTDTITGGLGSDTFVFNTIADSTTASTTWDVITDFVQGQDKIDLRGIDAFAGSRTNDAFVWKGTAAFNSTSVGEARYQQFGTAGTADAYTVVFLDNDADTAVEMAIRLHGLHNLTTTDFLL